MVQAHAVDGKVFGDVELFNRMKVDIKEISRSKKTTNQSQLWMVVCAGELEAQDNAGGTTKGSVCCTLSRFG